MTTFIFTHCPLGIRASDLHQDERKANLRGEWLGVVVVCENFVEIHVLVWTAHWLGWWNSGNVIHVKTVSGTLDNEKQREQGGNYRDDTCPEEESWMRVFCTGMSRV